LGSAIRDGEPASFGDAFETNPLLSPYNADGSLNIFPWAEDNFVTNPLEGLNIINNDDAKSIVTNNFVKFDFPFLKGLSYKANVGYTYRNNTTETYFGRDTRRGFTSKGESRNRNNNNEDWLLEHIVTYNKSFNKHNIDFTGLYSSQKRTLTQHGIDGVGFPSDLQTFYQTGIAASVVASDNYSQEANISQMGRINYSYDGKYLLTLTARRDGFSGFGSDTKFGVFPVAAFAWNVSQENFMQGVNWVDNLKLRTSYGKTGNQAIGAYSTLPQLSAQHNLNTDKTPALGYFPNRLGDPSLGWESTTGFNLGVDYGVLNGRISGAIDYFNTKTTDLLLDKSISQVNGVKNIRQNIGATKNSGIDFSISSMNVKSANFSWSTDLNLSRAMNKIDNVGLTDAAGNYIDDIGNRWFIGQPIDVNYGYVFEGIWQTGEVATGSAQPAAKPGDVKVRDISGPNGVPDGIISATHDKIVLSSRVPDFVAGLGNSFTYKNLSLSFFIRAVQGVYKSNPLLNTFFSGRNGGLDREFWTAENPINTYPANREDANPLGVGYFDDKTSNASFIRLQDVSLSYSLPKSMTSRLKLDRLQFFVNAKNLATGTQWTGLDPEFTSQTDRPQVKSYIIGLRTQF
ncbi:MAG TPA: SusC/RagA family TonB-linked outer membrane protein, partial [Daejeonella sp.]|nr:SusC/RagA family TonB-linked outer membrane protein [Daejeonella sp.]